MSTSTPTIQSAPATVHPGRRRWGVAALGATALVSLGIGVATHAPTSQAAGPITIEGRCVIAEVTVGTVPVSRTVCLPE